MGESFENISQMAQDAFYQNFRPANAFLREVHFDFLVSAADAKLKAMAYERQKMLNLKMRLINEPIILSDSFYITEVVNIVEGKAILKYPILNFLGDVADSSVAEVNVGSCDPLIRVNVSEQWAAKKIKDVVFWFRNGQEISFINLKDNCNAEKGSVMYVPYLEKGCSVDKGRVMDILQMVSVFIKQAKEGVVIDMTNDGNPNAVLGTEITNFLTKGRNGN